MPAITPPKAAYLIISEFQHMLVHNAKVYIAGRNAKKVHEAITDLKEETGKEALFLQLDLSDLQSVKECAEEFLRFVRTLGE
jgi:retinol dehydrogenase 12